MSHDSNVVCILKTYSRLSYQPPPGQYTVVASFYLLSVSTLPKIISIATGTKCLPTSRYPLKGEALHDSHAEILARRGAIRWFLLEILRSSYECSGAYESPWIERGLDRRYKLKEGVHICLYISTPPCKTAITIMIPINMFILLVFVSS